MVPFHAPPNLTPYPTTAPVTPDLPLPPMASMMSQMERMTQVPINSTHLALVHIISR